MEQVLSILGFSLGASLGMGVVRTVGVGLRPVMLGVLKAGLTVTDSARTAASRAGGAVASATAEARENLSDLRAEAASERATGSGRSRRESAPRKIVIAKE